MKTPCLKPGKIKIHRAKRALEERVLARLYKKSPRKLDLLVKVSTIINSSLDPAEIHNKTIETIMNLLEAEAGSLLLLDKTTGELYFEVATGESGRKLKEIRLKKGEGIAGWVAEKGLPLIISDAQTDSRFYRKADEKSKFHTRSVIAVPVRFKGKLIGVIQGINRKRGEFTDYDLGLMTVLANQVGIAMENAILYTSLKETFYSTAEALAQTVELKDPYTGGHTKRVMMYSMVIGKSLGLEKEELEKLRMAAILHDIGKIGIEDNVLLKQGELDEEEQKKIGKHPEYAADILGHVKHLDSIIPSVRGHHERLDGKGYPDRLRGAQIPLIARIIAVADTFDAMTTERPYRGMRKAEEVFEELRKCAGDQFDPDVVEALVDAWASGELAL